MIAPATGEVSFPDGLCIPPFAPIKRVNALLEKTARIQSRELPVPGWRQFELGEHKSGYGTFAVEATVGNEDRVEAVFLSHSHSFYNKPAPEDAERRIFHESVITTELRGQREFSWGSVLCKLDATQNRDWLVVIFNPFNHVPRPEKRAAMILRAHADIPKDAMR